jgi:hypothetical protein
MNTITAAADVVDKVKATLVAESIDDAIVTMDLGEVPAALAAGLPVVAVQPPELTFLNYDAADAEFELIVIAGPNQDRLAAWRVIDPIIQALRLPLNIDTAKPANFAHPAMPEYPAYVLTFSDTI